MIRGVRANKPSFRAVEFKPGLNIVLAERSNQSTDRDSRNGLGKSTLIEIIHYCLASRKWPDEAKLEGWEFTVDLEVAGRKVSVTRATGQDSILVRGDTRGWPGQESLGDRGREYSIDQWSAFLGREWFGLPAASEPQKFAPSFRSLISYVARHGQEAYFDPFETHKNTQEWDKQVNNAYLLGLAWETMGQWQIVKERQKVLSNLRQAVRSGYFGDLMGSVGLTKVSKLEAERVRLEDRHRREAESLRSFRVHPQYKEIQEQANKLTTRIHDLANSNVANHQLIHLYRENVASESGPSIDGVLQLYRDAGVALPGLVIQRLEDVRAFTSALFATDAISLNRRLDD